MGGASFTPTLLLMLSIDRAIRQRVETCCSSSKTFPDLLVFRASHWNRTFILQSTTFIGACTLYCTWKFVTAVTSRQGFTGGDPTVHILSGSEEPRINFGRGFESTRRDSFLRVFYSSSGNNACPEFHIGRGWSILTEL